MAEQRLERDLRAGLAAELDPVHGPHPLWADAPVAGRIGASGRVASRWRTAALVVAAAVGVVAIAVLATTSSDVPVATAPPATVEPWPSPLPPTATPTTGEIPLGRVAVATAFGEPALLVRVSDAVPARDLETGKEGVSLLVEVHVVGPLDREVGVDRFVILRAGRPDPDAIWVADPVGFPIPSGAPEGTQASARTAVFFDPDETVDLGYAGSGSSVTFRYPVHRPPPVPSLEGRCPTLEDYSLASLQPSAEPAPPSFDPVAPEATASTGILALGETGVLPAPDGSPGALVRVSNVRFCDRLPNYRPDWSGGPVNGLAKLLLADVEIKSLRQDALAGGFIPGKEIVVANYGGRYDVSSALVFDMPGANWTTSLDTGPGFAYSGTIAWEVPDDAVRVTLDVQGAERDASGDRLVRFSYLARGGTDWAPSTPGPSSDPAATPTSGEARLGEPVVLGAQGGTMPLVVDGVDEVPAYPGAAPSPPAAAFLEARLAFGRGSGTFTFDPAEWVVVGPDGEALAQLRLPEDDQLPAGWPNVLSWSVAGEIPPEFAGLPAFVVAEVPADGRITLEYRPDEDPALVTWVLRDE